MSAQVAVVSPVRSLRGPLVLFLFVRVSKASFSTFPTPPPITWVPKHSRPESLVSLAS